MKLNKQLVEQANKTSDMIVKEVDKRVLNIHKVLLHTKGLISAVGVDKGVIDKYLPKDEDLENISTSKKLEKFVMRDLITPIAQDIERELKRIKKAINPEVQERIECVKEKRKYKNVNSLESLIDNFRGKIEDKIDSFLSENNLGREISKLIVALKDQVVSILESMEKSVSGFINGMEKAVAKHKTHEEKQELSQAKPKEITLS